MLWISFLLYQHKELPHIFYILRHKRPSESSVKYPALNFKCFTAGLGTKSVCIAYKVTNLTDIMTNYLKLHYFNIFLKLFYCIISSFLSFRVTSEQNLWQKHVGGAHSQLGLRFVFWNLAGCVIHRGILCYQFCSSSSVFLETTFINCI